MFGRWGMWALVGADQAVAIADAGQVGMNLERGFCVD
jgi:hypothetical protein